ncbi:MAG: 5'/3'-nucleotidase SurE [Gemmatimonadota bacterium]|nr:5'/3'-nucleotidase SurE [Gemmatimonadota bacterium]
MNILCSNDDGVFAPGLDVLVRAASKLGAVTVVAPDREQSATSHSLTMHRPLRPVRLADNRYQVDGTPTDCVMLAIEALMSEKPSWVLSGINHGMNMGEDVLYSGTVAAAMEGLVLGVPSIALSFAGGDMRAEPERLEQHFGAVVDLLEHLMSLDVPRSTLFNVNLPPVFGPDIKGVKLTRLGQRQYSNSIRPMSDPWSRPLYWIGAGAMSWTGGADSDYKAVEEGYISVTPLHLDLTNSAMFDSAESWWRRP